MGATQQEALTRSARLVKWPAVAVERSLIAVKPDAVHCRFAREILGRIEAGGFEIREAEARHRPSGPRGGAVRGAPREPVVRRARRVHHLGLDLGARRPRRSGDRDGAGDDGCDGSANVVPGTVRGVFAPSMPDKLVHGPCSSEPAEREIALWSGD